MVSAPAVSARRQALALLLGAIFAVPGLAQQRPAFTFQSNVVSVALPDSVLENPTVKKQLASGLTTTFLVVARQRDAGSVSGARVEVRYDLWDEVWLVRRVEFDGRNERQRITTREAFERWWRSPLRLLSTTADRIPLEIDVNVLPFSAAEEEDVRQWIAKSGGVGTASGGAGGLVDALIGTTLSAKPITSFRWSVDLTLR